MQLGSLFNILRELCVEGSWRAGCGVKLASWARSEVGELGGLYAPHQAPSGGMRRTALVLFPPRRATPSDTENNGQSPPRGNGATCAGVLSTSARELGAPHGGTVHPTAEHTTAAAHGKAIPTRRAGGRPKGERAAMVTLHKYAAPRAPNFV